VNNQRISVTQRQSVLDAKELAEAGLNGKQIFEVLERVKMESSIYITVDTLKFLKKGGRITPAAAALGTLLRIKPVLQIQGDGPVKLAVAEAQPDLTVRATAKVVGDVPVEASLKSMLDASRQGRCVITLDPKDRQPGQQPYQGVVPLHGEQGEPMQQLSEVLEHYMLQSEQLETRLILAADDQVAAGLLIQRLPLEGAGNLEVRSEDEEARLHEGYNRIAHLAATLKREELLALDTPTILRRLFWEEDLRLFEPQTPRFGCTCSRERVARMLVGLGREEVDSVIAERGEIEVGCDFCGAKYTFDSIDASALFVPAADHPSGSGTMQ
jgi:molecular chaperone Hsp33